MAGIPAGIINLKSDQYITRIKVLTERWPAHVTICIASPESEEECFGPYGDFLETEPNVVFEQSGSKIHSFFGYSGSWLDRIGVYYEDRNGRDLPQLACN